MNKETTVALPGKLKSFKSFNNLFMPQHQNGGPTENMKTYALLIPLILCIVFVLVSTIAVYSTLAAIYDPMLLSLHSNHSIVIQNGYVNRFRVGPALRIFNEHIEVTNVQYNPRLRYYLEHKALNVSSDEVSEALFELGAFGAMNNSAMDSIPCSFVGNDFAIAYSYSFDRSVFVNGSVLISQQLSQGVNCEDLVSENNGDTTHVSGKCRVTDQQKCSLALIYQYHGPSELTNRSFHGQGSLTANRPSWRPGGSIQCSYHSRSERYKCPLTSRNLINHKKSVELIVENIWLESYNLTALNLQHGLTPVVTLGKRNAGKTFVSLVIPPAIMILVAIVASIIVCVMAKVDPSDQDLAIIVD